MTHVFVKAKAFELVKKLNWGDKEGEALNVDAHFNEKFSSKHIDIICNRLTGVDIDTIAQSNFAIIGIDIEGVYYKKLSLYCRYDGDLK